MYTIKYKTGAVHIDGLPEKLTNSQMNYSLSACSALSRSNFWAIGPQSENLAEIVDQAQYYGKRICLKCGAVAQEILDQS